MSLRIWRSCSSRRFRSSLIRGIVSFSSVMLRPDYRHTAPENPIRTGTTRIEQTTKAPPEIPHPRNSSIANGTHLPLSTTGLEKNSSGELLCLTSSAGLPSKSSNV